MLDKFLPPTENLYKFIAISGILLIIASYYPSYLTFKLGEQYYDLMRNQKILIADLDNINKRLSDVNQTASSLTEKYKEIEKKGDEIIEFSKQKNIKNKEIAKSIKQEIENYKYLQAEIEALKKRLESIDNLEEFRAKSEQQDIKNAELKVTSAQLEFYGNEIDRLKQLSWILFITGLGMIGYGFNRWYTKIQKINDAILSKQVDPKKKTIRKHFI